MPEEQGKRLELTIEDESQRFDVRLARHLPDLSRARIQSLIKDGHVLLNGKPAKPSHVVHPGDRVQVSIPPPEPVELQAQEIPLHVLYEDHDIIVINKPAGLVVHPAPGHDSGTLVNALLHHCRDLQGIGGEIRPGIVHRLDKDTSGVLVVAKNEAALTGLQSQFKHHTVSKNYNALVWGIPEPIEGTIDTLIGRDPNNRKKMSARPKAGRRAISRYRVEERFGEASFVAVSIETGRTHQIRVHMASIGHPIIGDTQYGRARKTRTAVRADRQMLHARSLAFSHPRTGQAMEFEAPLPRDMRELIAALRAM